MDLAIERLQDGVVIELPYEEIDASSADFKRALATVVDTERRLSFDPRRLRCGLSTAVRAVSELVRRHRVFDVDPTRDAAPRAFTPAAAAPGASA